MIKNKNKNLNYQKFKNTQRTFETYPKWSPGSPKCSPGNINVILSGDPLDNICVIHSTDPLDNSFRAPPCLRSPQMTTKNVEWIYIIKNPLDRALLHHEWHRQVDLCMENPLDSVLLDRKWTCRVDLCVEDPLDSVFRDRKWTCRVDLCMENPLDGTAFCPPWRPIGRQSNPKHGKLYQSALIYKRIEICRCAKKHWYSLAQTHSCP